jgi:hypothetical protein
MVPPTYPELKRVITMVRRPVMGPRVAMNDVAMPPRAPKQKIVATAWLESMNMGKKRHHDVVSEHTQNSK